MIVLAGCEGETPGPLGPDGDAVMDASAEHESGEADGPDAGDGAVQSDAPVSPDRPTPQDAGETAFMMWIFQKCCPTDAFVLIRLIDKTTGEQALLGPIERPTETASASFQCQRGHPICFGAYELGSLSGSRPLEWCLGQNGGPEDPGCCAPCSDQSIRTRLECLVTLPGVCS
jgi:hypothetical protein